MSTSPFQITQGIGGDNKEVVVLWGEIIIWLFAVCHSKPPSELRDRGLQHAVIA